MTAYASSSTLELVVVANSASPASILGVASFRVAAAAGTNLTVSAFSRAMRLFSSFPLLGAF